MKGTRSPLGMVCLGVSLAAVYVLLGMKLYVAWREGLWLDWALGNFLPEGLLRFVFGLPESWFRDGLVWLLSRDIVMYAAVFPLLVVVLGEMGKGRPGSGDQPEKR